MRGKIFNIEESKHTKITQIDGNETKGQREKRVDLE